MRVPVSVNALGTLRKVSENRERRAETHRGMVATLISTQTKMGTIMRPAINGTSVAAEDQEYCVPPLTG